MRRFLGGAIVGAFLVIVAALSLWLWLSSAPVVVIHNASAEAIAKLRVETNVGETHEAGPLEARASLRVPVSGRDMLIWVVADFAGSSLQSEKVYTTARVTILGVVYKDAVLLSHEL